MNSLRLVFMGTPDFAVPSLSELVTAGHDIVAVYTQPPRAAGRGQDVRKSSIHRFAESLEIPVRTPASLKDPSEQKAFSALNLDAGIVVAYGHILPKPILAAPRLGCLNVHASILPRWRGAAPIQRAIMAGDKVSGVTIMQMDEGLDTGPILLTEQVEITKQTTAGLLHDQLAFIGAQLLPQALSALARDVLVPTPQPQDNITYAPKIDKAEARIDWSKPSDELDCHIRGLSPVPGAWFQLTKDNRSLRVKVLRAEVTQGSGKPGETLDDKLTVACGQGALTLIEVQRQGKTPLSGRDFLRGLNIAPGTHLD